MHICCNFKNKMKKKTKETVIHVLSECFKQRLKNKNRHVWNKYKFAMCTDTFRITKTIFVLNEKKIGIYFSLGFGPFIPKVFKHFKRENIMYSTRQFKSPFLVHFSFVYSIPSLSLLWTSGLRASSTVPQMKSLNNLKHVFKWKKKQVFKLSFTVCSRDKILFKIV